jgi:hypothetical protein
MSNDLTAARRLREARPAKDRREDQARMDADAERAMAERPSEAGRPAAPPHPWDATPDNPCISGRPRHDFSSPMRDGLFRCWHCTKLSPRSLERLRAAGKE